MNRFSYFAFFSFFNLNSDINKKNEIKNKFVTQEKIEEKDVKLISEKKLVSNDMTHYYFLGVGGITQFGNLTLFLGVTSVPRSNTYEIVPESESQYSIIRNLQIEGGFMLEVIPFCGVAITVISKEFWNGGAKDFSMIAGCKMAGFVHLCNIWIEGGFMVKQGHKGTLLKGAKFFDRGISVFVSVKIKKESLYGTFGAIL